MVVQMDTPTLSSREDAEHLYAKNVELENTRHKSSHSRVPYDPNVWQKIRENYEAIILGDDVFSEQNEVELALWQLHYRRIEEMRALFNAVVSSNAVSMTQNGKGGPARPGRLSKIRCQFKTFLSEATGFYHELILKIRAKYGLPLSSFADDPANQFPLSEDGHKSTEIKKGLISCHRCLIYLGDLARYKGVYGDGDSKTRDFAAASIYYLQASSLWPSSGNPHHQLAIVAAYHGEELTTIYRYFRSLAVGSPFLTARDNLIIAFERNRQNYLQLIEDCKPSKIKVGVPRMNPKMRGRCEAKTFSKDIRSQTAPSKEKALIIPETFKAFTVKFIRMNGILFTRTSLETFVDVLSMIKSELMVLLSSESEEQYNFGSDAAECGLFIVMMVAILIFTVHNVKRESENQSYAEILQRSVLLQNAYTAVFELMGHVVERCSQLRDSLSSYLLPGVLVFMEWLASHPDIASSSELGENHAHARLFFWNACITFFNKLLLSGFLFDGEDESCFFNTSEYVEGEMGDQLALWEDFELRGFLPLHPAQQILNFSVNHSSRNEEGVKEKKTRIQRIIAAGKNFCGVVRVGEQGIFFDPNMKKFVVGAEPQSCVGFALSTVPEMSFFNGTGQESPAEMKPSQDVVKPPVPMFEVEDEEEVIVFKPSIADKQADAIFPTYTSYEDLGLVPNITHVDSEVYTQSVSATADHETVHQNDLDTPMRDLASAVNANTTGLVSIKSTSLVNGFKNINILGDLNNQKPSERSSILRSAALSLPFSQSINVNPDNVYPMAISDVMSSKIDVNICTQTTDNLCDFKPHSISSTNSKKNPVSRPTRHTGPPPGFTPASPKCSDIHGWSSMKSENPIIDDYSWLDGCKKPFSTKNKSGFNIDTNLNGSVFNHLDKSDAVPGAINFPFPGKQTSTFHIAVENHNHRQEYQFLDHLKLYEQQKQLKVSQPMSLPKQFQNQSMWEGRFMV